MVKQDSLHVPDSPIMRLGQKNYGVPLDKIIDSFSFFQILSSYRLVTTIAPATEIMIFILGN